METHYFKIHENEIYNNRTLKSDKPIIAYLPDIRIESDSNGNQVQYYHKKKFPQEVESFERAGAYVYPLHFFDFISIPQICKKINGLFISGGRDINPREYRQNIHGARTSKEWNLRFYFYSTMLRQLDNKVPIFGICWGYQFLNTYYGGSLIQNLDDTDWLHYNRNKFKIKDNTWLQSMIGDTAIGDCFHHQNLDIVPEIFSQTAFDERGQIHAIELVNNERFMVGVLWHCERSHIRKDPNCHYQQNSEQNQKILVGFVKECAKRMKKQISIYLQITIKIIYDDLNFIILQILVFMYFLDMLKQLLNYKEKFLIIQIFLYDYHLIFNFLNLQNIYLNVEIFLLQQIYFCLKKIYYYKKNLKNVHYFIV